MCITSNITFLIYQVNHFYIKNHEYMEVKCQMSINHRRFKKLWHNYSVEYYVTVQKNRLYILS